jgi:transposase
LVPLPAYTPELQPAERLWSLTNTPLVNARPADRDELDTLQVDRCAVLQTEPAYVAAIQSATHYHWWPTDYSPIT